MSKQNKNMSYGKFGLLICCRNDISCWDPLKSCGIPPWWDTIHELGLKFVMPHRNRLRGSDIGRMTGDVITGCGCWTNAAIIFKNAASLAACYWLSSFKKSSISLEEISEASVLNVFIVSFMSVKRLSVCPLDFFLLAGVGTYFLFAFDAPSEDLEEEPWLASFSQTSSSWLSSGLASWPLVFFCFFFLY